MARTNTYPNYCQRCNRQLKDPSAQYGWRCAEILGVAQNLNYAGDGAFNAYIVGINEADAFLTKNNIDTKKMDIVKFYESYVKQYLALEMNNRYLFNLAYDDMLSALSPKRDKSGNLIFEKLKSPDVEEVLNIRDISDYNNGSYSTTKFTNNSFNPYAHLLQEKFNQQGATDRFGNKLKEDGVFGAKTQWAADLANGIIPSINFINPLQTKTTNIANKAVLLKDGIGKNINYMLL